jgi:Ca2+-binding EF-hand superfamily protein
MEEIEAIINDDEKLTDITRAVFAEVDKNGNGFATRSEIWECMNVVSSEAGMDPPTENHLEDVLRALDTNRDGTINLEEFKVLIKAVLRALKDV